MFERYQEKGEWIPRDELSTRTRINLGALEKDYGFQFDNQALKARFSAYGPSYIVYGTSPDGKDAVYERREPGARGAGQTFIWIEGKKHRLHEYQFPIPVSQKERELIFSLGRIKEIEEEQAKKEQEHLEKVKGWYEAKEKIVKEELRDLDLSGLSPEERARLEVVVGDIVEESLPKLSKFHPIWDFKSVLSKEEKEGIKEAIEEYKKELGEYRT